MDKRCGGIRGRRSETKDLRNRISDTYIKKGDNRPMKKGIRSCFLILSMLFFLCGLLCWMQTNHNYKRINEILPSVYYIELSTPSVQLPSGQTAELHFKATNVEISDSYKCRSMEDCYALVFAIKSYAHSHGIEIVRSNTDLVGELRLHNFLYRIGYKQNEMGDADLEYICDRRWYVNVASRVIGWTGL